MIRITPHSYQEEAVQRVFEYFAYKHGNPIVAMPTGTGKSIVIALLLFRIFSAWPNQKVLCLTHVKELIEQNYAELLNLWPGAPAGVNSAGVGIRDVHDPIIFAGIQSVWKIAAQFGHVDLILIDEAHLVGDEEDAMYVTFIQQLKAINPNLKVVGLTATHYRSGLGYLTEGNLFTDVCFDITDMASFNRLINEGYLCTLIPKRTQTVIDVTGVQKRSDDFNDKQLQLAVNQREITESACREAIDVGRDRHHWLVFCTGVEHVKDTVDMLNFLGISAVGIHSKMKKAERKPAIDGWKSGLYTAAVSKDILSTGINFPAVDLILVLRPTLSTNKWVQMLGRGTRCVYAPGYDLSNFEQRMESIRIGGKTDCLVLDCAGNTRRLGPINDPVIPRKKGEKAGDAPIRLCEQCGTYNHASARKCVCCGYEFPVKSKLTTSASEEPLIKGELPVCEVFKVDHISYAEHFKPDTKPGLRITYFCGKRKFTEYVLLEHESSYAVRKAMSWWRDRSGYAPPLSTEQALERTGELRTPTHLRVWVNKQYPQIMAYCYDGTAFNTEEARDSDAGPTTEVMPSTKKLRDQADQMLQKALEDDDIPF